MSQTWNGTKKETPERRTYTVDDIAQILGIGRTSAYMVDHAEYIIGVFDNQKKLRSGTAQTVNYALRNGKAITLIHPDTMEITTPTT